MCTRKSVFYCATFFCSFLFFLQSGLNASRGRLGSASSEVLGRLISFCCFSVYIPSRSPAKQRHDLVVSYGTSHCCCNLCDIDGNQILNARSAHQPAPRPAPFHPIPTPQACINLVKRMIECASEIFPDLWQGYPAAASQG